jgi:hypothetical protein
LIEFGLLVLEKKIFKKKISVFLLFCYHLPLERVNPLHLNKLESPPQGFFVPSLVKLAQWL